MKHSSGVFIKNIFFTSVLLAVIISGCQTKASQDPKNYSGSLIVLPGALNINYAKVNNTDQVTYNLKVAYPAPEVISQLLKKTSDMGWSPLKEDFLNPGLPTSIVRGWSDYEDASRKPNTKVHSWQTDWQNKNGDVLIYGLKYRYPLNSQPDMSSMNVVAIYIPVKLAETMKKASLEMLDKYNKPQTK
jgi:hypothetical protein